MQLAKKKGCDGVVLLNLDSFLRPTGFPLLEADQRYFCDILSQTAHDNGLAVGLSFDFSFGSTIRQKLTLIEYLLPRCEFLLAESTIDNILNGTPEANNIFPVFNQFFLRSKPVFGS